MTIEVLRHSGTRVAISAEITGDLAVHEALGRTGTYSVTHLPTGMAVSQDLTEAQAKELVRRLCLTGVDWSFTDPQQAVLLSGVVLPVVKDVKAS